MTVFVTVTVAVAVREMDAVTVAVDDTVCDSESDADDVRDVDCV